MTNSIRSTTKDGRKVVMKYAGPLDDDQKSAAGDLTKYSLEGTQQPVSAEVTGDDEVTVTFADDIGNRRFFC